MSTKHWQTTRMAAHKILIVEDEQPIREMRATNAAFRAEPMAGPTWL